MYRSTGYYVIGRAPSHMIAAITNLLEIERRLAVSQVDSVWRHLRANGRIVEPFRSVCLVFS